MKLYIEQQAALSETGSRFLNEDRLYPGLTDAADDIPQVPGLYMVADGNGGQDKGDIAAKIAIREFARYIDTFPPTNAQITYGYLSAALLRVEEAFHQYISHNPESEGMATTISLVYADAKGIAMGWIGNSRVYHLRGGEALFQTRDQMVIQDMVAHGKLSPEEAEEQKNNFTQARMIHGTAQPTDLDFHFIAREDLEKGDIFLLCSDGVTKEISDKEIQTLLAGPFEEVKEKLAALCKNESSDNFSASIIQLGDVAVGAKEIPLTSSPALVDLETPAEIDLNELEEPPREYISSPEPEGATILDRFKSEEESDDSAELAAGGATLLDKIQAKSQAGPASIKGTDSETDSQDESASADKPEVEGRPRPDVSPEPRPGFLQRYGIPLLLGALLIAAAGYAISQLGGNEKKTQYQAYLKKAANSQEADSIIFYGKKAHTFADSEKDQNAARSMVDKGVKALHAEIGKLEEKAEKHLRDASTGGYADLWQAHGYYYDAFTKWEEYPELTKNNTVLVKLSDKIDAVQVRIDSVDTNKRISQLLARANKLCEESSVEEAGRFFDHSSELIGDNDKLRKSLADGRAACQPAKVADRGIDAAKPSATTKATDTKTKVAPTSPAGSETVADGEASKTDATPGAKPTKTQLQHLEKGIALFEKQRISNSNYEAQKAAEYLEKADIARTGAAAYMLSTLYNQGKGVKENQEKAMVYAKESALKGYPGGHFVYAALLLENANPVDSTTAKKSLNIAAGKGHPDATNLLYQLMQPAARLRP